MIINIWYISPSNQGANFGADGCGSEPDPMYLLALEITPHLDRAGVSFVIPERTMPLRQRIRHSNSLGACFHLALQSNTGTGLSYSGKGKAFCERLVNFLPDPGQKSRCQLKQAKNRSELRKTKAPAALIRVDFRDVSWGRQEMAEAIARCIIEADGKEFVSPGPTNSRKRQ